MPFFCLCERPSVLMVCRSGMQTKKWTKQKNEKKRWRNTLCLFRAACFSFLSTTLCSRFMPLLCRRCTIIAHGAFLLVGLLPSQHIILAFFLVFVFIVFKCQWPLSKTQACIEDKNVQASLSPAFVVLGQDGGRKKMYMQTCRSEKAPTRSKNENWQTCVYRACSFGMVAKKYVHSDHRVCIVT